MDINELFPNNEMLLDIEEVISGRTADQISRKLERCTEDIRKAYGITGDITFHITPNGLLASWQGEFEEAMSAEEFEVERQKKVEHRKQVVREKAARRVEHLKKIAAGTA